MKETAKSLTLHLILEKPPIGVDYGVQQGSGTGYVCVQKQRSQGEDLTFMVSLTLKSLPGELPVFTGPFAQGPPKERFVYLNIGKSAGQWDSAWSRRLKIPLRGITPEMIHWVLTDEQAVLEISVPGTAKDGSPACASVKGGEGWKVVPVGKE
ncbi:DUF5990 family protein [Runella slithyformis]|uniref:Uncharacterized protein n=1 Tax=Runella slithyformis (strain ATCC 29530 / DSM 19594 / LMG 11500 / NCIMB 11436 / LSU 4) TaxID=761193 RepID=A0A7U4E8N9_RUNSL|nr:DUF5990 family protein [Runella slithyformis]AEI51639.1 hypothetical protein Runsl_5346 [Runella slithyformis DSM 19594]